MYFLWGVNIPSLRELLLDLQMKKKSTFLRKGYQIM